MSDAWTHDISFGMGHFLERMPRVASWGEAS